MDATEILRVRAYLTPEESAFVEDDKIISALAFSRKMGRDNNVLNSNGMFLFAARIVRKALAKGMMP